MTIVDISKDYLELFTAKKDIETMPKNKLAGFKKEYIDEIKGFAPINVGDEFYLMVRAINGKGKFGYLACCDIKAFIHTGECGLSSGVSKITGENNLYEYKKSYFDKLDKKTIRYIKMRHYAVLAFAEVRRKKLGLFIKYA